MMFNWIFENTMYVSIASVFLWAMAIVLLIRFAAVGGVAKFGVWCAAVLLVICGMAWPIAVEVANRRRPPSSVDQPLNERAEPERRYINVIVPSATDEQSE